MQQCQKVFSEVNINKEKESYMFWNVLSFNKSFKKFTKRVREKIIYSDSHILWKKLY